MQTHKAIDTTGYDYPEEDLSIIKALVRQCRFQANLEGILAEENGFMAEFQGEKVTLKNVVFAPQIQDGKISGHCYELATLLAKRLDDQLGGKYHSVVVQGISDPIRRAMGAGMHFFVLMWPKSQAVFRDESVTKVIGIGPSGFSPLFSIWVSYDRPRRLPGNLLIIEPVTRKVRISDGSELFNPLWICDYAPFTPQTTDMELPFRHKSGRTLETDTVFMGRYGELFKDAQPERDAIIPSRNALIDLRFSLHSQAPALQMELQFRELSPKQSTISDKLWEWPVIFKTLPEEAPLKRLINRIAQAIC